jgi:hypothetical protein
VRIGDSCGGGRVAPRRGDEEETRLKHERVTMKIENKIDQNRGDRRVSHAVDRGEKILDFGSISCYEYYLYSSEGQRLIYIHIQAGEYIKNH